MLIAVGFGLRTLSRVLERAGDMAGDTGSRLVNHVSALVVLVSAGACFIWALKMMFFDKPRDTAESPPALQPVPQPADIFAERREEDNFDPDAALARYMRGRGAAGATDAPAPRPSGFGRKGL